VVGKALPRRVDDGVRLGDGLRTLADGLDDVEAVCWDPGCGALYAGGEAGQLYRIGLDGRTEVVVVVEGALLAGLAVDGGGDVYACDYRAGCVWRVRPDGSYGRHGEPIALPNYPVFDADGRLYVSDSGDWKETTGGVVVIEPDGATRRLETGPLRYANGLALDGDRLDVAESSAPAVARVPVNGGEAEVVVELEREVPDGIALDAEGGLWISCWQPNRILRVPPGGGRQVVVDDWTGVHVITPTNIAFAGEALDVLAIASLGGQTVQAIDPGVAGRPLSYPELPA